MRRDPDANAGGRMPFEWPFSRLSRRRFARLAGAASVAGLAGCTRLTGRPQNPLPLDHGAAVGDVTSESAVFWTRTAEPAIVRVEWSQDTSFGSPTQRKTRTDGDTDYTGTVRADTLEPDTRYHYRIWATAPSDAAARRPPVDEELVEQGTFRTAPTADTAARVTLAWSGDTYGYGGSPVEPPFSGLESIAELRPDFFVYLGDTIYADANTPAGDVSGVTDPEQAREIYRAKYREMRNPDPEVADETYLKPLLRSTAVYPMWDDHEVFNNFDRTHSLMPVGRDTFQEYWPIDAHETVTGTDPNRLYRSFRWGQHVELFILDTRQYRDPSRVDHAERTMLGDEQLAWLKAGLASSDATFKLVVSSTTMGITSGDGWSQRGRGYEAELNDLLSFIDEHGVRNIVVLSGDIHKAQVASYDPNEDYIWEFYEASAGPLGAPGGEPHQYAEPLNPTPHFDRGQNFFNFGVIEVEESGEHLWIEIRYETGKIAFSKRIPAVSV